MKPVCYKTSVLSIMLCALAVTACQPHPLPGAPSPAPTAVTAELVPLQPAGTLASSDGTTIAYRSDGQARPPRPTLFVLYTGADLLYSAEFSQQLAAPFVTAGWLVVSIDLPSHGADNRATEPTDGLTAWRFRVANGEDIAADFSRRLTSALSTLIALKVTDPSRVMLAGTSRAGFMALHAAARDTRVRAVAAFMPVTDLLALEEFAGMEQDALTARLNIARQAPALARLPIWITIGSSDTRVSTAACVGFVDRLKTAGAAVTFSLSDLPGHTFPSSAYTDATAWLLAK